MEMEKRTEGAWIIHHTKKIQDVTDAPDFGDIESAGKCGLFLSHLAASNQESVLSSDKVTAIQKATGINKLELKSIIKTLSDAKLIESTKGGDIAVLGITTSNVLIHTSDIFNSLNADPFQKASLEISNIISNSPKEEQLLKENISDRFKLDSTKTQNLFDQVEDVSFVDFELLGKKKIYFNGNLFKKDNIEKTSKVLDSLSSAESTKIIELDQILSTSGCITLDTAEKILGKILLSKLQSIGMYDFNEVSNDKHSKILLTRPSAFAKFGNPFEEDALDMAKAFIASLTYGMLLSHTSRGQIKSHQMLIYTLKKLLRGESVGPCTAIGQDYQVLERSRVIQLEHIKYGMYNMRLLKYDIGELALGVLLHGDLAEQSTLDLNLNSSSVSGYTGPEKNRIKTRRKRDTSSNLNLGEILRTMRK